MPPLPHLPTTREEMLQRDWDELDILFISGDAYVDHPSFGVPLLARWLEHNGFRVGIVSQPDWNDPASVTTMGRPRLFCGISAGCLDSMLAHYTAFRKKRSDDAYTPGGLAGARPNRAVTVYANLVRSAFSGVPVIIGGIEASLRRFVHYDFWTDQLRRSVLCDSKADLLVYGMGETAILEIATRLRAGESLAGIPGTARLLKKGDAIPQDTRELPSMDAMQAEPKLLIDASRMAEMQIHEGHHALVQDSGGRQVLCHMPSPPLSTEALDAIYALPFNGEPHPRYTERIPAAEMVRSSLTAVRGCGGGCSFCALALHQGRHIQSRSAESLRAEVSRLADRSAWDHVITDVGGPTANAWGSRCMGDVSRCTRASCYAPEPCPQLEVHQEDYLELLRSLVGMDGVKHLRVASGVRHDLASKEPAFVEGLVREFTGGQLKLAPEHAVNRVLALMRKGEFASFETFCDTFYSICADAGLKYYIVPYVMSAFPGCTMGDMHALADWFRARGWQPQQVQCFIPTPGTVASGMYYAECDPDGNPIHVAKSDRERLEQHHLLLGAAEAPEHSGRSGHEGRSGQMGRSGHSGKGGHVRNAHGGSRPASSGGRHGGPHGSSHGKSHGAHAPRGSRSDTRRDKKQ